MRRSSSSSSFRFPQKKLAIRLTIICFILCCSFGGLFSMAVYRSFTFSSAVSSPEAAPTWASASASGGIQVPSGSSESSRVDALESLLGNKEQEVSALEFEVRRLTRDLDAAVLEAQRAMHSLELERDKSHPSQHDDYADAHPVKMPEVPRESQDHQDDSSGRLRPPKKGKGGGGGGGGEGFVEDPFAAVDNPVYRPVLEFAEFEPYTEVYHLISHTHWDREWYLPFEKFRGLLVRLFDGVLDRLVADPTFKHFHIDGQMAPVTDFLEVRPQMRALLTELNRNGSLSMGPWYVQPDEFLVSGEALVRNLLLGTRMARQFGGSSRVGYLPDSFGHLAQIPQMMRGFGMDAVVSGRGIPDSYKTESRWIGSDGSEVLFVYMKDWYCNALDMKPDGSEAQVASWFRGKGSSLRSKGAATKHLLLMNGCDHTAPDPAVGEGIERANRELHKKGQHAVHSNIDDYVALVQKELLTSKPDLRSYEGELRAGVDGLANTLSNKVHQKQLNVMVQTMLERWLEPLGVLGWALAGAEYPRDTVWMAWKLLLENHPHDSICGCSAQGVHEDVDHRFKRLREITEQAVMLAAAPLAHAQLSPLLRSAGVAPVTGAGGHAAFVVFNPHNFPLRDVVIFEVDHLRVARHPKVLEASTGREVPAFLLRDLGRMWDYELPTVGFRRVTQHNRARVAVWVDVPPLGARVYSLQDGASATAAPQPLQPAAAQALAASRQLENAYLRAKIEDDGTVTVVDKATGIEYPALNRLEDAGDQGDQYLFRQSGSPVYGQAGAKISPVSAKPTHQSVTASVRVPRGPDGGYEVHVTYILRAGARRLEVLIRLHNMVQNHRLRALFRLPGGITGGTAEADGHFEVLRRTTRSVGAQRFFTTVAGPTAALTVANRGLPEYQIVGQQDTYAVTLVRSTGRIGDWGSFPVTTAQEQGDLAFEYAIIPHKGTAESHAFADLEARKFGERGQAVQSANYDGYVPRTLVDVFKSDLFHLVEADGTDSELYALAPAAEAAQPYYEEAPELLEGSFFDVKPYKLAVSALRKTDSRDSITLRIYNPYSKSVHASIATSLPVTKAFLMNLDESRIREEPMVSRKLYLDIAPKKIITLEFLL